MVNISYSSTSKQYPAIFVLVKSEKVTSSKQDSLQICTDRRES